MSKISKGTASFKKRFQRKRTQRYLSDKRKYKCLRKELKGERRVKKSEKKKEKLHNSPSQTFVICHQQNVLFERDIDIYEDENRRHLISKCNKIRNSKSPHIHLDFNKGGMSKISAAGMLLLYTEIYRKKTEAKKVKITCNYPSNRQAERVLQHIGFFELIEKSSRISSEEMGKTDENIRSWHVIKGTKVDGKEINDFLENVVENSNKEESTKIYVAINELISNAVDHAYTEDDMMKHWVVFGRVKEEGNLVLVVGDLGQTIPVAIKMNPFWKKTQKKIQNIKSNPSRIGREVKDLLRTYLPRDDSSLIAQAVTLGKSGTDEIYRGKGFQNVMRIKDINGRITVYSREGHVQVWHGKIDKKDPIPSIEGTIIEMIIPIKSIR